MTDEQLKQEFARWIDAGRPVVWYKRNDGSWGYVNAAPSWNNEDIYIVDDEHAELRKLQIDKPETKFEWFNGQRWCNCGSVPNWEPGRKYRVKPKEWYEDLDMIGKPVWVRDEDNEKWGIDIFIDYTDDKKYPFLCRNSDWTFAKPVKPEDLYQEK